MYFCDMIQRKQTLFLVAVSIISIVMLFVPFLSISSEPKMIWTVSLFPLSSIGMVNSNIYFPIVLNLLVFVLSILTIFQFKKRPLQYKLSNLIALLNVFTIGLFFLLPYTKDGFIGSISFLMGAFLPILSMGCSFLAAHFIKKDEQLVRSADRIR